MEKKVAGIFSTKEEADNFVQNLRTNGLYAPYEVVVNEDLLLTFKNKGLALNKKMIVIDVTENQLLKVQALIKNGNGQYVTPEELQSSVVNL